MSFGPLAPPEHQTIAVPIDRAERLAIVNVALDEFRASGFLKEAVTRSRGAAGTWSPRPPGPTIDQPSVFPAMDSARAALN
jgi:hypothetical protein